MNFKLAPIERSIVRVLSDGQSREWRQIAEEIEYAQKENEYWWVSVLNRLNLIGAILFDGERYSSNEICR